MVQSRNESFPRGFRFYDPQTKEAWATSQIESGYDASGAVQCAYVCVNDEGDERVVYHEEIDASVDPAILRSQRALAAEADSELATRLRVAFAGYDETRLAV